MILRNLRIKNFRQLVGENRIDFATAPEKNVTVVLGDSGAGKTTLLNAFVWCLYGNVNMANEEDVLSYKALLDAPIGSKLALEVSLVFENDGATYTVTREAEYRKEDGGKPTCLRGPDVRVDKVTATGTTTSEPDAQRFVDMLLPKGLSGFFLFRGEDMEEFARQEAAAQLRGGVEVFLDVKILDSAIKHADQVREEFEKELRQVSTGDVLELSNRIAGLTADKAEQEEKLDEAEGNVGALEKSKSEVNRKLAEVEEARPFLEQQKSLTESIANLDKLLAERYVALNSIVSRDGFLWFAPDVLDRPDALAEAAVQRGELPANIKPAFVDDRIALRKCICGADITEEMKNRLLEWRQCTGLAGIDEEIHSLRSAVKDMKVRREDSWKEFGNQRGLIAETLRQIGEETGRLSVATTTLHGRDFGLDYITKLQEHLRRLVDDIIGAKTSRNRIADRISEIERDIATLSAERNKKAKGQEASETLSRRIAAIANVGVSLRAMRDGWVSIVQEDLDGKLKVTWHEIAQLDRQVDFTKEFRLTMKELGGYNEWVPAAPSQANECALSIAFIASLVRLARDMHQAGRGAPASGGMLFRGGEFPLVMDAPFAKMDRDFKERIPEGLRRVVPQIVLITNNEQWKGAIADRLGPYAGKSYVIELHRPGDGEDGKQVEFLSQTVEYVVSERGIIRDWSILKEVKR
jgi:DNA sulfur modification protein DndD